MRILISNDDGVTSPGLAALKDALESSRAHEVWVVAPDGDRSGMSHYITLKDPIKTKRLSERVFSISGSPADCVNIALQGLVPQKVDVVLSGINLGANLGTDIIYSGTAAAARQASCMGVPGIALSVDGSSAPWHFGGIARFVAANLSRLTAHFDGEHFMNINAPNSDKVCNGIEITHPCYRVYNDKLVRFESPRGDEYWFLGGASVETTSEDGSDWNAVRRGYISVSPIHLQPQNNLVDEAYGKMVFEQPDG